MRGRYICAVIMPRIKIVKWLPAHSSDSLSETSLLDGLLFFFIYVVCSCCVLSYFLWYTCANALFVSGLSRSANPAMAPIHFGFGLCSPSNEGSVIPRIRSNIGLQIAVVNSNSNTYLHSPKWR